MYSIYLTKCMADWHTVYQTRWSFFYYTTPQSQSKGFGNRCWDTFYRQPNHAFRYYGNRTTPSITHWKVEESKIMEGSLGPGEDDQRCLWRSGSPGWISCSRTGESHWQLWPLDRKEGQKGTHSVEPWDPVCVKFISDVPSFFKTVDMIKCLFVILKTVFGYIDLSL